MKKKLFAVGTAALLALSLSACDNSKKDDATSGAGTGTTSTTTDSEQSN